MRKPLLAVFLAACLPSCSDEIDYVKIVVSGSDRTLAVSPLALRVDVSGGGRRSSFDYTARAKLVDRGATFDGNVSDFTVSFGDGASGPVDIVIRTRPSGEAVDWGGDATVELPAAGRDVRVVISRGESTLQSVRVLDGDVQTSAAYAGQLAIGWSPLATPGIALATVDPERPPGLDRVPDIANHAATKLRIASRPSSNFTSELFVTTWIRDGATPMIRAQTRTVAPDVVTNVAIGNPPIRGATDVHAACGRREASTAVATAVLADGRVIVHTHDDAGNPTSPALSTPDLERVNRIGGMAITPDDTITLAVNGSGARLVQISARDGKTLSVQPLSGPAVALSSNADGSRILVATVSGSGASGKLLLETFSARNPTRTDEPSVVGDYPLVPGVAASRVSLGSCAIAWPTLRSDGTELTDVRYREVDLDGRPVSDAHVANVARAGHHFAPTVVCLSQTRAFLTFLESEAVTGPTGRLVLRRIR